MGNDALALPKGEHLVNVALHKILIHTQSIKELYVVCPQCQFFEYKHLLKSAQYSEHKNLIRQILHAEH